MRLLLVIGAVLAALEGAALTFTFTLHGKTAVELGKSPAGQAVTAEVEVAVTPDSDSPDAYKLGGIWIGSADRKTAGIFSFAGGPPRRNPHILSNWLW